MNVAEGVTTDDKTTAAVSPLVTITTIEEVVEVMVDTIVRVRDRSIVMRKMI